MKIDMHYYGTYAMARAAGLSVAAAETIAYAAEFVDESVSGKHNIVEDGAHIVSETTAHHSSKAVLDYFKPDIDHSNENQRRIWVPFHFLPGAQGATYTEKLICRPNSAVAQQMFAAHLTKAKEPYALELMGVAAHVYADTFAHYDFCGVSSRWNELHGDSFDLHGHDDPLTEDYKKGFLKRFGGFLKMLNLRAKSNELAENAVGALGHAGAFTYPDIPYLHWSCRRERDGSILDHDNPATYVQACRELHGRFASFADACDDAHKDPATRRNFADIEDVVRDIIETPRPDTEGRIARWQSAVADKELYDGAEQSIKPFKAEEWVDQLKDLLNQDTSDAIPDSNIYRFYQAARVHRTLVLRDLLPGHGIVVV